MNTNNANWLKTKKNVLEYYLTHDFLYWQFLLRNVKTIIFQLFRTIDNLPAIFDFIKWINRHFVRKSQIYEPQPSYHCLNNLRAFSVKWLPIKSKTKYMFDEGIGWSTLLYKTQTK